MWTINMFSLCVISSAVVCPTLRPEVKMNGELIVSGANYSDTAFLECSPGYTLSGQSIVMCQSNGTWSATLGHCLMSSGKL